MGAIIGPVEEEEGYDKNFSAAVNIATAPTGLLIPPSNVMITFAMVSGGTSIAALFMAGVISINVQTIRRITFIIRRKEAIQAASVMRLRKRLK